MKKIGFLYLVFTISQTALFAETTLQKQDVSLLDNIVYTDPPSYIVTSPVADLRREPRFIDGTAALRRPYGLDPLQETQLIYGERVKVLEKKMGWLRVEAIEQPEYTHNNQWEGYPGWVLKKNFKLDLKDVTPNAVVIRRYTKVYDSPSRKSRFLEIPLGARVQILYEKKPWIRIKRPGKADGWVKAKDVRRFENIPKDEVNLRRSVIKTASLFIGEPYYWGGRAGHRADWPEAPSGVDCSGLVNLSYRVNGINVPRDSHEQYMKSYPLSSASELKMGDLIFLAKEKKPHKIFHVMLYAGGDRLYEAVHEFDTVRRTTMKNKIGKSLSELSPMEPVNGHYVYFGRILSNSH